MDQTTREDLIHHFEKLALIVVIMFTIYCFHLSPDQASALKAAAKEATVAPVRS